MSRPTKPLGMMDSSKWLMIAATTPKALKPSSSGRYLRLRGKCGSVLEKGSMPFWIPVFKRIL
ncbi:hypothetical protein EBR21_04430 [bacterium]|nr:hypothetical protein [bacterium]